MKEILRIVFESKIIRGIVLTIFIVGLCLALLVPAVQYFNPLVDPPIPQPVFIGE
jgi:hypothetical protein